MTVDAHAHLNRVENEKDFTNGLRRMILSADQNGIDRIVIIADSILNGTCADTNHILDCVGGDDRFYVIGSPNVVSDDNADLEYFEKLLRDRQIIGFKLFPGHEAFYPTDETCDPVYKLAIKYDCPVVIHTGINTGDSDCAKYNDPKYIVEIAKRYSKLRIIVAHYFWPEIEYCFEITKDVDNIYYDTSALADEEVIELSGGKAKIIDILERTVQLKPNSLIFGSDYGACDQRAHVDLINEMQITEIQREQIFSTNFAKCFKVTL